MSKICDWDIVPDASLLIAASAIGPTADLPKALRRAFDPRHDFEPMPAPGLHDWLSNHS